MANKNNEKEEKKRIRRIIEIIVVIIILLLLIRSCSKEFGWTVGKLFGTSSHHEITDKSDPIIILNKNLKFDSKEEVINLYDNDYKVSFSFNLINPSEFTCTTSDAEIATCYVIDDYVVINPKKTGKVSVYVETKTNNKVYKASMKLTIEDENKGISLSSRNGTMVLSKTNKRTLTYNLRNIVGDVTVKSSDENIATASITNGVVTITGKKAGKCKITVSVVDRESNKTYKVVYNLTIINDISDDNNGYDSNVNPEKPSPSSNPTTNPDNTPEPTNTPSPTTTSTPEPTVTNNPVVEKDSNNYLKQIKLSTGSLNPEFDKTITNYNVSVENKISKLDIKVTKDSSKSTIKYSFNNKTVNNLNDLILKVGDNIVEMIVTAENNEERVYTIIINRKEKESSSNYLKDLYIEGYTISPAFNKNTSFYSLTVPYNEEEVSLKYVLENNNSKIKVALNNNKVSDLSNIKLNSGNNKLEVTVTDEEGNKRIYVIDIYKPTRTIKFYDYSHVIYIESSPYNVNYKILEDGVVVNDYNLSDINVSISNFNGTYELNKDYISIIPSNSDINKNFDLKVSYNNITVTTQLSIKMNNYYINSPALNYDISYVNNTGKKNIIINNNILTGTITKKNITNGFRLMSDNGAYIDVITGNNLISVSYDESNSSNNSIVLKVNALSAGTSSLSIKGSIFDKVINDYLINFNIISKYNIVIDANGGFFDSVTDKYIYLVEETDEIDLSELKALKVDDEENCLFFKLDSFNTKADGTGTKYSKTDILTNFNKDITLYAIYTSTSSFELLASNERLYLTEVELFHNEEYYEKYNVDKIIYPGAEGSHVMSLTNNGIGKIKITGINLEEDTLCISDGKCLNIGYIIKSALNPSDPYTYYYGSSNEYKVLNKDTRTTHTFGSLTGYHTENNVNITPNIEIEVGETKEISLLWKWVHIDDELDTKIGSNLSTIGDTYSLTVSIDFERESNTCTLP